MIVDPQSLLELPPIAFLRAVWEAAARLGMAGVPMPVAAVAAGAAPVVVFSPELSADELGGRMGGAAGAARMMELAGAHGEWAAENAAALQAVERGEGAVVVEDAGEAGGWIVVARETGSESLAAARRAGAEGKQMFVVRGGEERPDVDWGDRVLRQVAALSQDRSAEGEGPALVAGPVAVDGLRRALAKACQKGFEAEDKAEGWLRKLLPLSAGHLFLAAEALRYLEGMAGEKRVRMAVTPAAANMDCACAYLIGAATAAEAGLGWPQRAGTEGPPSLDAAQWGVIYEMLRQASYHWRAAAGWVARELARRSQGGEREG